MLTEMNCVFFEIGRLVPGLKTNRMPDAGDDVEEGVAREGGVFGFLLCDWSRRVCRLRARGDQVDVVRFLLCG